MGICIRNNYKKYTTSIHYFNALSPSFKKSVRIHLPIQVECCKWNGLKFLKRNENEGTGKVFLLWTF